MNYPALITLLITAAYLYYIKVIPSISDSYRTIKDKRIYHAFFFVSAVLIACQGATTEEKLVIPYVIAGFFFYGISLAAAFWINGEGWLHVLCTYIAISVGLTLTVIRLWPAWGFKAMFLVAGALIVALFAPVVIKKNSTYWQEVAAYLIIFGPIL